MQIIDVEELKKVLEFEPLDIKTDGSIDRKAVIDFLSGIANLDPKAKGSLVMYIMSLPDMQPGRKTGKWIYGEHDVVMCDGYWCDKCGFFVPWDYQHKSIDFINDYHFCPSCGADMRGKE